MTIAQQQMFDIIPKIFYGQYECRFGHAFHTIQLFILHGHQLLIDSPTALKSILEMSMASLSTIKYKNRILSESENAEGVLILHSLVLRCGAALTQEMLMAVINSVIRRLEQPIQFQFLSAKYHSFYTVFTPSYRCCSTSPCASSKTQSTKPSLPESSPTSAASPRSSTPLRPS